MKSLRFLPNLGSHLGNVQSKFSVLECRNVRERKLAEKSQIYYHSQKL